MGEPSSSWQNFNFRDDEGSAQGMQALRLLLAKLQEAQANPRLKPSVNNLLMTEDLMLTSTQRLPSSVAPMHLEGGERVPVMHGPMQANVVPHPLQGPLQTDGAKKKQYHGQERHVGKIREEGDFHDDDDEPPSRSRHKKRNNERRTKRSRRNSSGGSSSSSQSGRSSHGRFPKKGSLKLVTSSVLVLVTDFCILAVIANGPFEKWGIDAMGYLPRTANGKLYILVAIDYMTRFGTPLEIVSDNGPGFRRGLLTELCEELKISHRHSTTYYPQSNGLVEKANGIIAGIIRKMVESKPKRWDNFLDGAIWAYKTTYRDATQFTPFHLVYGQEALQPIELNIPTIKLTGRQEQNNDEAWIDRLLNLVELEWKREAAYHC
ncbi:hypothetical protein L7F22_068324 [Adiantum nelumboides]|nr:hypothetical protein [Adiantum nelumboides]